MIEPARPKRILFATDFSVYSERAREWALGLSRLAGASVTILHVIDFVDTASDPHLRTWFEKLKEESAVRLQEEVDRFRQGGVAAEGELAVGEPSETIMEKTASLEADLIVVGSHGLTTREGRFLLGTTSHRIALGANLPVLIVKAENQASN